MKILGYVGDRPWKDLPATALVIIFKKLPLKDRFLGGSMVCQSWQEASKNPQCWESMLYNGLTTTTYKYSFEYLFIKARRNSTFDCSPFGRMKLTTKVVQTFVERSKGNATTIIIHFTNEKDAEFLLNLITLRCPKLNNLSMRCTYLFKSWSYEAIVKLVNLLHMCKELELVDLEIPFCISGTNPPQDRIHISPKIRGLRVLCMGKADWLQNIHGVFFMECGNIELLSFPTLALRSSDQFEWILDSFRNLKFLRVGRCGFSFDSEIKEKKKRMTPTLHEISYVPKEHLLVLITKFIYMSICGWFQIEVNV